MRLSPFLGAATTIRVSIAHLGSSSMKTHQTKNDLPTNAKAAVIAVLNENLAAAIDLALATKQAHWNLKGPQFIAVHEMLDGFRNDLDEHIDTLAERAVQLGGTALGSLQAVSAGTKLKPYPTGIYTVHVHLRAYGHKPRRDPRRGSCGLWAAGFEVLGKLDDLVFRIDRRHEFDRLWVTRRSIAAFASGGHYLSVAPRGGTRGTLWVTPCRSMALGVRGRHREHALVRRLRWHRTGVSEGSCVACPRANPVGTAIRDRSDRDLDRFHCNRNRGRISIPSRGYGLTGCCYLRRGR